MPTIYAITRTDLQISYSACTYINFIHLILLHMAYSATTREITWTTKSHRLSRYSLEELQARITSKSDDSQVRPDILYPILYDSSILCMICLQTIISPSDFPIFLFGLLRSNQRCPLAFHRFGYDNGFRYLSYDEHLVG